MAVAEHFICRECGRESLRWEGRCPGCEAWNSFEPVVRARRGGGRRGSDPASGPVPDLPRPIAEAEGPPRSRLRTGFGDFDRVLGGGWVEGSIALLAGPPGIGKSTLLLQVAGRIAATGGPALYVSGEESAGQVRRRAHRIREETGGVLFLSETSAEVVVAAAAADPPAFLCVDSIQTVTTERSDSAPGSLSQVREATDLLRGFAKRSGTPTVLVGHVTKGGGIAGPRTLEHAVDAVLHFEGARGEDARLLRATKNRFGRVGEIALYRMSARGLVAVSDPGRILLEERGSGPGSALTVTFEGGRPFAVEVQALTARSSQATPRRMTTGFSPRRLAMLLAVLERRGGLALDRSEVFVNVVGGLRISDPGGDAGVLAALISAELDRPLPPAAAFLGEVGLSGEFRGAGHLGARVRELSRIGVTDIVRAGGRAPGERSAEEDGEEDGDASADPVATARLHALSDVRGLVEWIRSREVADGAAPGRGPAAGAVSRSGP